MAFGIEVKRATRLSAPCAFAEGSLTLSATLRPSPRSGVPTPDLSPAGGPHPLALRAVDRLGVVVTLFSVPLVVGFAPAPFGLLGTPLGFQGASLSLLGPFLCLLGAAFSLSGSSLGCLSAPFGFLNPSLGFLSASLGLFSLPLGFALAPFGLLSAYLGFLRSCLSFLDSPLRFFGAPLGPRRTPLVEGKHRIEEIHVVICRYLCEVLHRLACKLLLIGQLLRYLQGVLGLGAKVVDHGIEEVLDLLST